MALDDITQLADLPSAKRLVIKIGSALLVEKGRPRLRWLRSLAGEIARLRETTEIIIVSSGAIALGARQLGLTRGGRAKLTDAQAAAAVGQVSLARIWSEVLEEVGLTAAQILVTPNDLENRRRYLNASATLGRLLESGTVPVVNENDSVATAEIRFGDNDRLAARLAQAIHADGLILLSDVDGLYTAPPGDAGARLVKQVDGIDPEILAMAGTLSGSGLGTGGMAAKLAAAQIAERAGIAMAIINGTHDAPLSRAFDGGVGTIFLAQQTANARKAWLNARQNAAGHVRVDAGCETALRGGASLLAAGIIGVSGQFRRGDLVRVDNGKGTAIAQGLIEYTSREVLAIAGKRDGEQAAVLGYAPRPTVIHRDHMVLL